jgi:hypothetical protein
MQIGIEHADQVRPAILCEGGLMTANRLETGKEDTQTTSRSPVTERLHGGVNGSNSEDPNMLTAATHIAHWRQLIRAEYLEIPGLSLTKPQVQRLWGLDPVTSEAVLAALVDVKFLRRTAKDAYVRADVG